MAKQLGAIRLIGKLANTIGYKARDGKGDSFDALRVYTQQVANPQTTRQMNQRMKLTPVQNFYRGLQGLLDHSWQGVKYGNPSRLFFYSQAMKALSAVGVPYVPKGERKFVPWAFPISSGSIPVSVPVSIDSNSNGSFRISGLGGTSLDSESTIGQISSVFSGLLGIQMGMQLTFIFVYKNNGLYIPAYQRIILNEASEETAWDQGLEFVGNESNYFSVYLVRNTERITNELVAAGVIVSSLVNDVWQRNNASLVISDTLRNEYRNTSAYEAMLSSYRTSNNTESDWYLNEGDDTDTSGGGGGSSTDGIVTEVTATIDGQQRTFAYVRKGYSKYVPYRESGDSILVFKRSSDSQFTYVGGATITTLAGLGETITNFSDAGYQLVPYGQVNTYTGGSYTFVLPE